MKGVFSSLRAATIYFSLLLLFSFLATNRFAPSAVNADYVLMSIMSLQRVTLFYWGQDRFANFIPFAMSLVTKPHLNLFLHFLFFSLAFFSLLFVCARLIIRVSGDPMKPASVLCAFGLLVATFFLCMRPSVLADFVPLGQPYAISYLLLLATCGLVLWANQPRWLSWISASLGLFISTGFNSSIFIPAIALGIGAALVRRSWHGLLFVAVASASFFVWSILAKLYGAPNTVSYSTFHRRGTNIRFVAALDSIVQQWNLPILLTIMSFICLIHLIRQMKWQTATSRFSMPILSFALMWLFVFSQNKWVAMHNMRLTYFFPVFLAPVFLISLALYSEFRLLGSRVRNGVSVLWMSFAIYYLTGAYVPVRKYPSLAKARMDAKFAAHNRIALIGGNYWKAWPTVFELMNAKQKAFGVAWRAEGNRESAANEVNSEYSEQGQVRLLCFGSSREECKVELDRITGTAWQLKAVEYQDDDKTISVWKRTENK